MEIIVAYKQNGQYLHPDHGFPARCIIPGWIAGRMVKWLSEIKVTDQESDNYYHFYDNKVRYVTLESILPSPCPRRSSTEHRGVSYPSIVQLLDKATVSEGLNSSAHVAESETNTWIHGITTTQQQGYNGMACTRWLSR